MVKLLLTEEERAIVDILNPRKRKSELPEKLPVDFIINNRICYLFYNKVGSKLDSKYKSEELEPIYRKARYMEASINELQNITKVLEENDIDFVFLFKAIVSHCDSTDIDIYLEDNEVEKAGKVLERSGYFAPLFPFEKYDFVKSEENNKVIQIDLLFKRWGNICHYIFGEGKITRLLSNKRKINGLYLPSPEGELMIGILRMIEKKGIPLCTVLYIAHLLENCHDIDYIKSCIKKGWYVPLLHSVYLVSILYTSLFDKEIESPLVDVAKRVHEGSKILRFLVKRETKKITFPFYSKTFLSYWYTCKLLSNIWTLNFKEIAKSIFEPFRTMGYLIEFVSVARKKRLLICFSGIDGTGKTTHATTLVRRFKDMRIPCQYAYCIFEPKVSYPFMALVYLIKGYRRKDYYKSRILRRIWNYIVILDFLYIYFTKVKIPLLIGKSVICDRYVYDWIAALKYDGLYNERASKILLKIIPKPDLVFILDIPEEVSNVRKDDTKDAVNIKDSDSALDYLTIHRKNYLKIAKSLDIPVIDATKDLKELNEEFYKQIIQTYINKQK